MRKEKKEEDGEVEVEVEREVEESREGKHMCDMWMKMTDSGTT